MICNKERLGRVNFKESHTVISFDIFDTLLIRTIEPLEQIHHFVFDRAFLQRFGGIDRFQMLRAWKSIESRLRANAAQAGYDSECSDEEIIACLAQELGKEGVGTHDLLESALSIEKYFLEPMPNMRLLLERLAKHHRIIAISDTIFSARILSKLLESCGYANLIDRVYSSSDFKLSKASGRLFLKVLDEERVQKESICHIGDNALSDYCVPRHLGMQSILLYDEWNLKRKAELRILGRKRNGSAFFSGQTIISHVKSKDWQGNDKEKRLYEWGRDILGPLLTIFTHCLVNQIKKDAVHKLYFIAREGFLLQRIFSFFSLEFDERRLPESALVPVSRFTAFLSSIKSLGSRELAIAAWGNPGVDILLKRLGIDNPGEVIDCLDRYSLAIGDNCGSFLTRKRLYQLFNDEQFQEIVFCRAQRMRDLLKQVLKQEHFYSPDGKKAFVDVGWIGTIQDCIEYAYEEDKNFPECVGYYLALNPPIIASNSRKKGLLYDYRESYPEALSITLFREALEFACRSHHGAIIDYKEDSISTVVPVFQESPEERQIDRHLVLVQDGILDFTKAYINHQKIHGIDPADWQAFFIKRYEQYHSFPEKSDIAALSQIVVTQDFGSKTLSPLVRDFALKDMLRPHQFLESLRQTPWKEASLASLRIPFLLVAAYVAKRFASWIRINAYTKHA